MRCLTALLLSLPVLAPLAEDSPPAASTASVEVAFKGTASCNNTPNKQGFVLEVTAPWEEGKGWATGEGSLRFKKIDDGYAETDSLDPAAIRDMKKELKEAAKLTLTFKIGDEGAVDLDLKPLLPPLDRSSGTVTFHGHTKEYLANDLKSCLRLLFVLRADRSESSGDLQTSMQNFREAISLDSARKDEKTGAVECTKCKVVLKELLHLGPYGGEYGGISMGPDGKPLDAKGETKKLTSSGTCWMRSPEGILWKFEDKAEWSVQKPAAKGDKGFILAMKRTRSLSCSNLKVEPPKP